MLKPLTRWVIFSNHYMENNLLSNDEIIEHVGLVTELGQAGYLGFLLEDIHFLV